MKETREAIIKAAREKGIDLTPEDIRVTDDGYVIDGMPWDEWLEAMTDL